MLRKIVKSVLIFIFAINGVLHVLYLAPINPATTLYTKTVERYMSYFFTQNWHLFAPEPAVAALNINYRCQSGDPWKTLLEPMFKEHKKSLITSLGKQTYVYQHLSREIYNTEIKKRNPENLAEFKILSNIIEESCQKLSGGSLNLKFNAEFNIERAFTKNFSERNKTTIAKNSTPQFNYLTNTGGGKWNSINQ